MSAALLWSPHGTSGRPGPGDTPFPPGVLASAAAVDLPREVVHLAWELARLLPAAQSTEAERRALLLLALALLAAQRDGSTRVPVEAAPAAEGGLAALIATLGGSPEDIATAHSLLAAGLAGDPRLGAILGRAGEYRPLLLVQGHLYAQRLWQLEGRVAACLRGLLGSPQATSHATVDAALADVRARPASDGRGRPVRLSDEQEEAVHRALQGGVAAITGGPGTGKTWVVAALLRVVARLGSPAVSEIALAAPTGKAADRLQASLRGALAGIADPSALDTRLLAEPPRASTLHRLLSYSPAGERFLHHERNPLSARLVLVDESSMLDLAVADRLLRSLPAGGRLVLLGDARQLPSVDAGAVFRDLVQGAAASGRIATLTRSWRMDAADPAGSAILDVAATVSRGGSFGAAGTDALQRQTAAAALTFRGVELLLSPPATLASFLDCWWRQRVLALPGWQELVCRPWRLTEDELDPSETARLAPLFAHYEASRLLTVTRGWSGGTGAAALHSWFHAALRREVGAQAEHPGDWLPGEPVLVTRNDYRRGLYNGDQGLVLAIAAAPDRPQRMAVLRRDQGFRAFPLAALQGSLEPAWASTVHKAQGSEHDAVALVLPGADSRLLTRELLYTAVTRARRSVILVGSEERLAATVARAVERWSGLADALPEVSPPAPVPRQQLALPFDP